MRSSVTSLGLVAAIGLGAFVTGASGVSVGQIDDFEDGTTQGWGINLLGMGVPPPQALPHNVATGGPAGADDNFLQLTSVGGGGPGSRMSVINFQSQWAGDYLAAGISALEMDVNNTGISDLHLRLLFSDPGLGPPANVAFTSDAIVVPAGSGWTRVVFPIRPDDLTSAIGSINSALSNTTELRLFHNPDPGFAGPTDSIPAIVASLGVDNIRAQATTPSTAVPEPLTAGSCAAAMLALAAVATRRRGG